MMAMIIAPDEVPAVSDLEGEAAPQERQEVQEQGQTRPKKKRVLTEARKEQNRIAQRVFRQKKREKREELKAKAESASATERVSPSTADDAQPTEDPKIPTFDDPTEIDPDLVRFDAVIGDCTGTSLIDTHPSNSDGSPGTVSEPPHSLPLTSPHSGTPGSASMAGSDPLANTLEFKETTVLSAMLQNARAMGFNLDDVGSCRYDMMSPLYRPATPSSDPAALMLSSSMFSGTRARQGKGHAMPPDLQPSLNQVLIPHHVSLDLVPFPALRDRLIVLSAAMPATFNMWELKLDIYDRNGLNIVKGKKRRDGKGEFQPWDRRCWVAEPWFLRKWRVIVEEERQQLAGPSD